MDTLQKRLLLFFFGCIGSRVALAYFAKIASPVVLPYMGVVASIIAIGFTYIYVTGSRKTGAETFGQPIWWNSLRPIHAFLYAWFAYKAISGHNDAWVPLAIDVVVALAAHVLHYHLRVL
jgi:hypothetical protein